ncbi:MAG: helix-turn-helix transcriptional regulator [bacterium]|nr:helix-turn-helix transcriptional regulator [bacterium]
MLSGYNPPMVSENGILKKIGQRFRLIRELLGLNQKEMSIAISMPEGFAWQFENNRWNKPLPLFENLYERFGVNTTWLHTGKQNMFITKGPKTPERAFLISALVHCREPESLAILQSLAANDSKTWAVIFQLAPGLRKFFPTHR